ncbi:MAG: hypothetical protein AAFV29_13405, partial [Myxococcota bacterium]
MNGSLWGIARVLVLAALVGTGACSEDDPRISGSTRWVIFTASTCSYQRGEYEDPRDSPQTS